MITITLLDSNGHEQGSTVFHGEAMDMAFDYMDHLDGVGHEYIAVMTAA